MIILGLTGSIGMGKTTAAGMFRRLGVAVHDSDATVHQLYDRGGAAVPVIDAAFPGSVRDGRVDRSLLAPHVVGQPDALKRLESLIHPLVKADRERFLRLARGRRAPMVVLDIPLLFETGSDGICDVVAVVSAPYQVQAKRVLARPEMTAEKFQAILARQMPDREKRRRADIIIPTGRGLGLARQVIQALVHRAWQMTGKMA